MATDADLAPTPEGFVRLVASMRLNSDPDRVVALLGLGGTPWAPALVDDPGGGGDLRRFAVDLRLRVGSQSAGLTTFRKAAFVDLGRPRWTASGWGAEISWLASTAAPLFPVFSGWLSIGPAELRIDGLYAPPGGALGQAADRLLLHTAANATARWVLNEIDLAALDPAA